MSNSMLKMFYKILFFKLLISISLVNCNDGGIPDGNYIIEAADYGKILTGTIDRNPPKEIIPTPLSVQRRSEDLNDVQIWNVKRTDQEYTHPFYVIELKSLLGTDLDRSILKYRLVDSVGVYKDSFAIRKTREGSFVIKRNFKYQKNNDGKCLKYDVLTGSAILKGCQAGVGAYLWYFYPVD